MADTFQTSEELYPYSPGAVIGGAAKAITGGGIAKGDLSGEDRSYGISGETIDTAKVLSTGQMAQQSIDRQLQDISYDEFTKRIGSGEIPNVGTYPDQMLITDVEILQDPSIDANFKDQSLIRLQEAYEIYTDEIKPTAKNPVAFGLETSPGIYKFAPTDEAKKDPKLKTTQENIFTAQSRVATVVKNEFANATGTTDADQDRIENVFIRNLSTGSFWDTLVEKVNDDNLRGPAEFIDMVFNYGTHAVEAAAAAGLSYLSPFHNSRGFMEQWEDTAEQRANFSQGLKKHFLEPVLGIKSLSSTMNTMVQTELERQLKNGDIDKETFDRITTFKTVDPITKKEVSGPRQFVSEELSQALLTNAIDTLSGDEEYGVLLASNLIGLAGVGKAKFAKGNANLKRIELEVDKLRKKAEAEDATDADIMAYKAVEGMSVIQAGRALKTQGVYKGFNEKAALFSVGIKTADANMVRLSKERSRISAEMKTMRDAPGFSSLSPEYKTLEFEFRRLSNMTLNKYVTGRFVPITKEAIKDAVPMSAFMYWQSQEDSTLRNLVGGDRMMAEGLAALLYIGPGKFAATATGKTAYWVNQQAGDLSAHVQSGLENIISIPFEKIGFNGIRGYLANRDLEGLAKVYAARTGQQLPPSARAALIQMGKLSSVLTEESLDQIVVSAERMQNRVKKLVDAFPAEERVEMTKMLSETLASTTSVDWMRSISRLEGIKIDGANLNSLDNMEEMMQAQRIMTLQSQKSTRLIEMLESKVLGRTDLKNPEEITDYIASLKQAKINNDQLLLDEKADLNILIEDFKANIISDPSQDIPDGVIAGLDNMSIEIQTSLKGDVAALNLAEEKYQKNVSLLAKRAAAASEYRSTESKHIKTVARNAEMIIDNKLERMRRRAKSGFVSVDKKAREMGAVLSINPMIEDLMKYAPESELQEMFGKNSRLFVGTLGKKLYTTVNKMAKRSLESMEGSTYSELYKLSTNKNSPMYIGENPKPLDIMLHYMRQAKENPDAVQQAPQFLATPGEVMDVFGAFEDYAFRIKDDNFSSQLTAYASSVEDVVRKQAPELFEDWKAARETYQAEWFDKLRAGGPLQEIHKSKDGPITVAGKKPLNADSVFLEDVAVGESVPEGKVRDRLFRQAYKGLTPLEGFNKIGTSIENALAGKPDAMQNLMLRRSEFIESFSDGVDDVFDLSNPKIKTEFELMQAHMTEVVYSRWGNRTAKKLSDPRLSPDSNVLEQGGYNWEGMQDFDQVQNALTVLVRNTKGGKPRRIKLVDLGKMIEEEASIEKLIGENKGLQKKASEFKQKVLTNLNASQTTVTSKLGIEDQGATKLREMIGLSNSKQFFETAVLNGNKGSLDAFIAKTKLQIGDTFEIDGVVYNTEEAIDKGVANLIVSGLFEHGNVGPIPGATYISPAGVPSPIIGVNNPEMILEAMGKENVETILKGVMSDEHFDLFKETVTHLTEQVGFDRGVFTTAGQVENVARAFGTNQLISRGFNLARGMVSPQYVAAEFAVSLASHAGIDMLKLAAGNEAANDLIIKMFKYPRQMTKADVATFGNLVTEFVVTELGSMGLDGVEILDTFIEKEIKKMKEEGTYTPIEDQPAPIDEAMSLLFDNQEGNLN